MHVSPPGGRVPGRMCISPIKRYQNSRHQIYWRISVGKIKISLLSKALQSTDILNISSDIRCHNTYMHNTIYNHQTFRNNLSVPIATQIYTIYTMLDLTAWLNKVKTGDFVNTALSVLMPSDIFPESFKSCPLDQ